MNVNQIKIVLQIQGIPEKTKENYQVTLQSQKLQENKRRNKTDNQNQN